MVLRLVWALTLIPPAPVDGGQVVDHGAFQLCYVEAHEQAAWVYYVLNIPRLQKNVPRKGNFRMDPKVTTGGVAGGTGGTTTMASKPAPKPAPAKPAPALSGYGLQVGAFLSAKAAGRLAARYKRRGMAAVVRPMKIRKKQYHLVIVGAYKTARLARRAGRALRRQGKIKRFYVRRLR